MSENVMALLFLVACLLAGTAWYLRKQSRQPRAFILPVNRLALTPEQTRDAGRTERALAFFRLFTRRTNTVLISLVALVLAAITTFFMPETLLEWVGWGLICVSLLTGLAALLHFWRKWIGIQEATLLRHVYLVEEHILNASGVITRNAETGLYTQEFAEHMLELYTSHFVGRILPVTCLVFETAGLEELAGTAGNEAAARVQGEVGNMLRRYVHGSDIVYQASRNRLGIVLLRYPVSANDHVEKRLLLKCHDMLEKYGQLHHSDLQVHWSGAILPLQARTPMHLLHIGGASLDVSIAVSQKTTSGRPSPTQAHEPA